ncbi:hypothetical protein F4677DRAFT_410881 [Hypoxylon crocopeplum]|nr:hypothetical protein F4677DRAFT_410881 [Hypoxylon crocopeplum]
MVLSKARQGPHENRGQAPFRGHSLTLRDIRPDRVDEYGRLNYLSAAPPSSRERDTYPSLLSKGPGAPQPLTAGPPGQRHFPPSTLNPPTYSSDESLGHTFDSFDDSDPRVKKRPSIQPEGLAYPTLQRPSPAFDGERGSSAQASANVPPAMMTDKAKKDSSKIVDTLTTEEARRFYPHGLPADFNHNTKPLPGNWMERRIREAEEDKLKDQLSLQQSYGYQAIRKDNIDRDFYVGTRMMHQNFLMASRRDFGPDTASALSSPAGDCQKPFDKPVGHMISIKDANDLSTHEHAKPLLGMAYLTLVNHPGDPFRERSSQSSQPSMDNGPR